MAENEIRKIIYFDKETIRNVLQEINRGDFSKTTEESMTFQSEGSAEVSLEVKLDIPFWDRFKFLFSSRIAASYMVRKDSSTTITSTELSEFEKLKSKLTKMEDITICDIENSSTSLRVAGGYLKMVKGGVDGVDIKEFKAVMDSYEGYDTYMAKKNQYVRFNNTAFLSNYKRNELLATTMTLYCIPVGKFRKDRFDFIEELSKMEHLVSKTSVKQTLADVYPPLNRLNEPLDKNVQSADNTEELIELLDAVYACISTGKKNG